ncbi:hypothetical protein SDC9_203540 [bioreactor metagenome]|uniref:Uncharacterized protein n=1 Tax=bioreactor metagenome TaxID=1076179 RepID=A0A645IXG6_9ZZZZ
MVLDHIPQCTYSIVESTPTANTHIFDSGNLYPVNVIAVPDRFKNRVCKTECQYILYGFLPEIMVYPVYLPLFERLFEHQVHFVTAFKIVAERLFNYYLVPLIQLMFFEEERNLSVK